LTESIFLLLVWRPFSGEIFPARRRKENCQSRRGIALSLSLSRGEKQASFSVPPLKLPLILLLTLASHRAIMRQGGRKLCCSFLRDAPLLTPHPPSSHLRHTFVQKGKWVLVCVRAKTGEKVATSWYITRCCSYDYGGEKASRYMSEVSF